MVRRLHSLSHMRIASGITALLVTGGVAAIMVGGEGPAGAERREVTHAAEPPSQASVLPRSASSGRDSAPSVGEPRPVAAARVRLEPFLEPAEITAEVKPYASTVERCYLARLGETRRAGKLDLRLLIGRDGSVVSVTVTADGLSSRSARKTGECIREVIAGLRFPARRNDTIAVVPYYFQRTEAPGAGPQLSCWSPRGC